MLSVLMATFNGADTIDRTLAAMSELDAPPGGWKLVIVNNASTDDTERLILKWRDRLPLEYIVEPRLGKSRAMNSALDHAEGDFIVMTDDDVLPDRNWLTEWRRVADAYPDITIFGGTIIPEFDGSPPTIPLEEACLIVLYAKTPHQVEGEIEPIDISGPNLSIRRCIVDQGWRFGDAYMVGRTGLLGDETDFIRRLSLNGHKVGFAPSARVRHIVHKDQTSWAWIHRRYFRHGRTIFMMDDVHHDEATNRLVFRFPWWKLRKIPESVFLLIKAAVTRDNFELYRMSRILSYDLGAMSQALTLAWQLKSLRTGAP